MAHRRTIRTRGSPSLKTWDATNPILATSFAIPAAGFNTPAVGFAGVVSDRDATVLRTRGYIDWTVDKLVGLEQIQCAWALGIVTEEAAIGLAVPTPLDNPEWDGWFIYETIILGGENATDGRDVGMKFDSKAMRKIQAGNVIVALAQARNISAAAGALLGSSLFARALFKTS